MPLALPLSPIFWTIFRYALIAGLAAAAARRADPVPRDQRVEDVLDSLDDGLRLRRDEDTTRIAAKAGHSLRLGPNGPGLRMEFAGLGRLKLHRL
ncbi:hypothetical protein [Poseidonocella sp. HB161398]|uniref:hypothetical protein n=1 Tax=Poseidonocella sp. HB161398 TaxID=2320855 RepID=UPI001108F10D|nr:hypothetical protein [Poseidonocella sp. HB161398]